MAKNESNADRILRLIVALVAGGLGFATSGVLQVVLFVVAAIMLVTAAVGFCPLYRIFGLATNKSTTAAR